MFVVVLDSWRVWLIFGSFCNLVISYSGGHLGSCSKCSVLTNHSTVFSVMQDTSWLTAARQECFVLYSCFVLQFFMMFLIFRFQ